MALQALSGGQAALRAFPIQERTWTATEDIQASTKDNPYVDAIIKTQYSCLDIEETFTSLVLCGGMLQVALTAAGRQPCCTQILLCLSHYQTLVNNSCVASGAFVTSCISALKSHKLIIMAFERGRGELGIKQFERCAVVALEMAAMAEALEKDAEALTATAEKGLEQASKDSAHTDAEAEAVKQVMQTLKNKQAGMEESLRQLAQQYEEEKQREQEYMRRQSEEDTKGLIGTVIGAIGEVCQPAMAAGGKILQKIGLKDEDKRKDDPSYKAMMNRAAEKRREIAEQERKQRQELAEALSAISADGMRTNSLKTTIQLLTTTYQTLGKIVTTFKNVKMFWQSVAKHCKSLVDLKEEVTDVWAITEEYDDDIKLSVLQSAVSWASLGKVCLEANTSMVSAKSFTDGVMNELPDGNACSEQVEKLKSSLLSSLKQSEDNLAQTLAVEDASEDNLADNLAQTLAVEDASEDNLADNLAQTSAVEDT